MSELAARSFDSPAAYAAGLSEAIRGDARFEAFIGYRPPSLEHSAAHLAGLQALLFDVGWSRLGWPESAGGLGGSRQPVGRGGPADLAEAAIWLGRAEAKGFPGALALLARAHDRQAFL